MSGKSRAFKPLVKRVNFIIIVSLIIGVSLVITFLSARFIVQMNNFAKSNALVKASIAKRAIETVMLPGEGQLALDLMNRIREHEQDTEVNIYRSDGTPAFSDSATRDFVNARLGFQKFTHQPLLTMSGMRPKQEYFEQVLKLKSYPSDILFRENRDGDDYLTLYTPLINGPNCIVCHSEVPTARGIIEVAYDFREEAWAQKLTIIISVSLFALLVSSLALALSQFMKRTIISPVREIGGVCLQVTQGDFSPRVHIDNRDEIGALGDTVNTMVDGLYERFELSKFVSSSTIRSLRGDKTARKDELTMFFSDIRGFTSYSEKNDAGKVVNILNDLLTMQTEIIHKYNGDIDKYVGDEVVAVFTDEDQILRACQSALEIQRSVAASEEYDNLKVGIGINTGEVLLGLVGSEKRADFTVIGDNVNIASRLCGAAKGGQIILSESSYKTVNDKIEAKGPFKLSVKGKETALKVYLLTGIRSVD